MSSLAAFSIPSTLHQFTPALSTGPLKSSGTKANASGTTGTTATSSGTNGSAASIGSTFLSPPLPWIQPRWSGR